MKAAPLWRQADDLHNSHGGDSRRLSATCQRGAARLRAELVGFDVIANRLQYLTAIRPPHRLPPTDRRPQRSH